MQRRLTIHHIFLLAVMLSAAATAFGQTAKKTQLAPSYSWSVVPPLGLREPAAMDTLYENYSLEFIPQEVSYAYAATGNYGGPGYNMLFMQREPISEFYYHQAVAPWVPSEAKARFYNTRIPMTLLSYNFGGGKQDSQERFSTIFSANANSRFQVGALLDYIYSKGSYDYQAAKDLNWGFSTSYIGERYELQAFFTHFNLLTKENGGITDDLYITDPAEVQAGNTSVNCKEIPVNLTNAYNRVKGTQFYMNHRYKMGFYKEEQIDDTTTVSTLVPVTSIIWTLKYADGKRKFYNFDANDNLDFWENTYFNPDMTADLQKYWKLRNTVGISLLEGFNKYAKAGLAAYLTHEIHRYDLSTAMPESEVATEGILAENPYPGGLHNESRNALWVGAQLTKQQGRIFNYQATGELGLVGMATGEVKVSGNITTRVPLLGDTVPVRAFGHFTNTTAPWLMQHYYSNHYIWQNDFSKIRSVKVGGQLDIPWTRTTLTAQVENLQNHIYFDSQAMPQQYSGSVQVFSATLMQYLKFGPLHWDNVITYQTSSNQSVIPLPQLALNSNLYLIFRIATLSVQMGVNCDYFTRYKGVAYQPATMAFYNQNTTDIGNYPFVSAYFNFKLSRTRFYIMMSHLNQGMTGTNYFSMPHYPMNPRRLQMGLCVDFAD